jgi:hypothetical protein
MTIEAASARARPFSSRTPRATPGRPAAPRRCEEQSDEAIHPARRLDGFASLAMTARARACADTNPGKTYPP